MQALIKPESPLLFKEQCFAILLLAIPTLSGPCREENQVNIASTLCKTRAYIHNMKPYNGICRCILACPGGS